jgi:hypothetical protein
MIIGVLKVTLLLHGNDSLKGKRQVANSLKQKLRNKFNLAVSEIEGQDDHDRLVLAAVTLANETSRVESSLNKALSMIQEATSEEVADVSMDVFSAS